ncbi:hypothetical protein [Lewinella cohaerens]|uniref:gliding motility protein GldB-related protein n=1 Tax=Lewinella cohaerens TaxID=70995 RepID=UPI0003795CAD|nr:hypothetical protein [Lewinella cohaerens]
MLQYSKQSLTIFIFFGLLLAACTDDKRPLPDVSDIETPLTILRFEQDLFSLDTLDFANSIAGLATKYPEFAELFSTSILEAGSLASMSPEQLDYFRGFVTSPVYRAVYDTTQMIFPDLADTEKELQQALRYFRYYFPEIEAPQRLITFNSAFNYASIIFGENDLGVSLDMFLGPNFDYQKYSPGAAIFSNYLVRTYNKDYLTSSLLRVLLDDVFGSAPGTRLLDEMVHRGKKLYVLEQLLPEVTDTVIFKTTATQQEWLVENERNLWSHFLTEDLLYNSRFQDIRKLIEPSPNGSPVLPEDSPGESANYVGYQIVKQFMERHPEIPLSDLLVYQDAQEILEQSRYKPSRK